MSENNTLSIDSFEQLEADITGCRSCSRLVEWRELVAEEKRAAYRNEDYWESRSQGLVTRRLGSSFSALRQPHTEQTAPAACLPVTAVAIGCFGRCIGQGWPTSRNHCRLTTGLNFATRGYLRRCAVPLLQINRQPKNEIPVSRF